MAKECSKRKPKTLLHYTSWEALLGMLNSTIGKEEPHELTLHASHISAMNDCSEGKLMFDYFFTGSDISEEIRKKYLEYQKEKGDWYVVSFSSSREMEENIIPLWKMYADGGKGVCLHFNFRNLNDYIDKHKKLEKNNYDIELVECQYMTKKEIIKDAEALRAKIKQEIKRGNDLSSLIKKLLYKSSTIKERYWAYEDEYRLLIMSKDANYKIGGLGLVPYQKIQLPISLIKKITIGPMATQDVEEHCLQLLRSTLNLSNNDLKINNSKLELQ